MIFINFKRKFFRVIGYIICAILIILCIVLIISASAFGSQNSVNVFGANIYIVQKDNIPDISKGSAVIVKRCSASDLNENNMVLYMNGETPDLGYVKSITRDENGLLTRVETGDMVYDVPEANVVGLAEYNSQILGAVISFIKTPLGVFCIAVLPCIALILYDILRAFAAKKPLPEIEPQVKNVPTAEDRTVYPASSSKLSVNSDGKASYSRVKTQSSVKAADKVLFNYSAKQHNKLAPPIAEAPKSANLSAAEKDKDTPKTPMAAALGSYVQNTKKPVPFFKDNTSNSGKEPFFIKIKDQNTDSGDENQYKPERNTVKKVTEKPNDSLLLKDILDKQTGSKPSGAFGEKTAERPLVGRQNPNKAFFAQTSEPTKPPQIGFFGKNETARDSARSSTGRRSSQILASKRVEDLISDDEDVHDRSRISETLIDDILSGMDKKI